MEIQKGVRVGDTATTTPGPVSASPSGYSIIAPHHGRVAGVDVFFRLGPATCHCRSLHRSCRILFEQRALCRRSHVTGPLKTSVRIPGQQLTIFGIVTQQAVGQAQTGSKDTLMRRETRPIAKTVSRITTLGHCRFELRLTLDVALFIHVPQVVFE